MLYKVHCENIAEGDSVLIPHLASTGAGLGRNLTNNGSLWPIFNDLNTLACIWSSS